MPTHLIVRLKYSDWVEINCVWQGIPDINNAFTSTAVYGTCIEVCDDIL